MKAAIHLGPGKDFTQDLIIYERILRHNGIETVRIHIDDADFWTVLKTVDVFIYRWHHFDDHKQIAKSILPIIENHMNIKCFPDQNTCWHYDDKIKQFYLLHQYGFPFIPCHVFYDRLDALNWVKTAEFPVVFKLFGGAASRNVILLKEASQARKIIRKMFSTGIRSNKIPLRDSTKSVEFTLYNWLHNQGGNLLRRMKGMDVSPFWAVHKNYVLFQKFIPNNDYDTRIIIIGNHAYGEKRLNRPGDFRASGGGRLIFDPKEIDLVFIETAFQISKKLRFQSIAYDFLYDENRKPALCEISYTFPFELFHEKCPGYWDDQLNFHEGHYWPQYFQLLETLQIPLEQPEITI